MNKTLLHIFKNYQKYILVFAGIILILLSCPVKSSIKTIAGFPSHKEQGLTKGNSAFWGNNIQQCANSEVAETAISFSVDVNHLLPALLLTATFLFLHGYMFYKEPSHFLDEPLKAYNSLPLFLQHCRLII